MSLWLWPLYFLLVLGTSYSSLTFPFPCFLEFPQKNATLGGALTGALFSAATNNHRDKVVKDAITGGAIATAVKFINYRT
jgi:hypothetical protein